MTRNTQDQKGFTLIELLLALAVFSFVLLFITTAFIQLFQTYNRGVTRKEVDQDTRLLMSDITDRMRTVSSGAQINTSQVSKGRLCVGGSSYVWNPVVRPGGWTTDNKVDGQVVNMVRVDGDNAQTACDPTVTNITAGTPTSVFSARVGLITVSLTPLSGVTGLYQVNLTASTTQTDLLDVLQKCTTQVNSSPFCAQVTLQSTVGLRND
jgi:prepilin-type N-terminal cleavage/methylation domain-containing protein